MNISPPTDVASDSPHKMNGCNGSMPVAYLEVASFRRAIEHAPKGNQLAIVSKYEAKLSDHVDRGELDEGAALESLQELVDSSGIVAIHGQEKVLAAMGRLRPAVPTDPTDADITRLAKLSDVRYERERKDVAARYGIRASALDRLVERERKASAGAVEDTKGQGRAYQSPEFEPWSEPVDGAAALTEAAAAIRRYVAMSDGEDAIVALWAMHTHCFDQFQHSPRLAVTSPEKGCGKTTLMGVVGRLVARTLSTENATTSAIFRIVEMARPTLLIDEADTFLNDNDGLRGILNSGHRKGGSTLRTVGDDHEPRLFSTWAPCAIALIGRLPDTLEDRSVNLSLRRRLSGEYIEGFRAERAHDLDLLARKLARWAKDHATELGAADPDMGEMRNRVADNWRPLFAIADAAGGEWPNRARSAAIGALAIRDDQSIRAKLLVDIKAAFATKATDRLSSEDLTEYLVNLDDSPWAEWKKDGRPLTKASLARLLSPFGISSTSVRTDDRHTPKGYYLSSFEDAFSRYIPSESATTQQAYSRSDFGSFQSATPEKLVAL